MKKLILLFTVCLVACGPMPERHKRHHTHKKAVVHRYDLDVNLDGIADLFEYLIKDGDGCYITKSPTQISNFTNVQWTRMATMPPELAKEQVDGKEEVEEQELEENLEVDMTENPDSFEDASGDGGDSGGSDGGDSGGDSGGDGGGDGGGGGD